MNLQRTRPKGRLAGSKGAAVPRPANEPNLKLYSGRVAKRLRTLRHERGMSVETLMEQMAKRNCPVARSHVYAWENGTRTIPPDAYPYLASVFGFKSVVEFLPNK